MAAVATSGWNGSVEVVLVSIDINEPPIPAHIFYQTLNEALVIRLSASGDEGPRRKHTRNPSDRYRGVRPRNRAKFAFSLIPAHQATLPFSTIFEVKI